MIHIILEYKKMDTIKHKKPGILLPGFSINMDGYEMASCTISFSFSIGTLSCSIESL
jgi:hypothetical protein